jgi:Holliday junction resolvasome RuvABC endonuclease subunit
VKSFATLALQNGKVPFQRKHNEKKTELLGVFDDVVRCQAIKKTLYNLLCTRISPNTHCVVSVEGPAFGRNSTRSIQTGMLHNAVYRALIRASRSCSSITFTVVTVPPKTLKRFVAGKGTADKVSMMEAIIKRWRPPAFGSQDLYDAYALARCGESLFKGIPHWLWDKVQVHELRGGRVSISTAKPPGILRLVSSPSC